VAGLAAARRARPRTRWCSLQNSHRESAGLRQRRARRPRRARFDRCPRRGHRARRRDRPLAGFTRMRALLTLQDVEPAVRVNAALEREGIETALVSPLDDIRSSIRREKPDVLVFTADLTDPLTVALVKEQLWDGAPSVGLAESSDPDLMVRLR